MLGGDLLECLVGFCVVLSKVVVVFSWCGCYVIGWLVCGGGRSVLVICW